MEESNVQNADQNQENQQPSLPSFFKLEQVAQEGNEPAGNGPSADEIYAQRFAQDWGMSPKEFRAQYEKPQEPTYATEFARIADSFGDDAKAREWAKWHGQDWDNMSSQDMLFRAFKWEYPNGSRDQFAAWAHDFTEAKVPDFSGDPELDKEAYRAHQLNEAEIKRQNLIRSLNRDKRISEFRNIVNEKKLSSTPVDPEVAAKQRREEQAKTYNDTLEVFKNTPFSYSRALLENEDGPRFNLSGGLADFGVDEEGQAAFNESVATFWTNPVGYIQNKIGNDPAAVQKAVFMMEHGETLLDLLAKTVSEKNLNEVYNTLSTINQNSGSTTPGGASGQRPQDDSQRFGPNY